MPKPFFSKEIKLKMYIDTCTYLYLFMYFHIQLLESMLSIPFTCIIEDIIDPYALSTPPPPSKTTTTCIT